MPCKRTSTVEPGLPCSANSLVIISYTSGTDTSGGLPHIYRTDQNVGVVKQVQRCYAMDEQ